MTEYNRQSRLGSYDLRRAEVLVFAKYAVVGGTQNALFYGLSLGLIWLKFAAWQALALLYPLAVTVSFLANRSWSFGNRGRSRRQFRNYVLIYIIAYPLSIFFTWLQERLGVASWLASLVTMVVSACVIFLTLNYWVFSKTETVDGVALSDSAKTK